MKYFLLILVGAIMAISTNNTTLAQETEWNPTAVAPSNVAFWIGPCKNTKRELHVMRLYIRMPEFRAEHVRAGALVARNKQTGEVRIARLQKVSPTDPAKLVQTDPNVGVWLESVFVEDAVENQELWEIGYDIRIEVNGKKAHLKWGAEIPPKRPSAPSETASRGEKMFG
jgi:hypothetical protein